MPDLKRNVNLLVQVAKVEARLHAMKNEMQKIPQQASKLEKRIAELAAAEEAEVTRFENMQKERRTIESALQDHETQIAKYKKQLMEVKTNKEYTAMLKEIENLEGEIDRKEERLLVLMDETDLHREDHEERIEKLKTERTGLESELQELQQKMSGIESDAEKLASEKPQLLADMEPTIKKRYERVLGKHVDVAVTRVDDEHCGGCGTQLPPQVAVEVRKNDQLITCSFCGRLLIYYTD